MKLEHIIFCRKCEVYMELGGFDAQKGYFDGPYLHTTSARTDSDWALRRFLEDHRRHDIGFASDYEMEDVKLMGYTRIQPTDLFCMEFVPDPVRTYSFKDFSTRFQRVLFIVDIYDWAWDITSRELLRFLPEVDGRIVDLRDFEKMDFHPEDWDMILIYPWFSERVLSRLDPNNTIICVAGGEQLIELKRKFELNCGRFNVYGANTANIKRALQKQYPQKRVILLSHGVDTEKFKPDPIPHDKFTVGWVGAIGRDSKRVGLAKKICTELGIELKIAGRGVKGLYIPHDEMPQFYNCLPPYELIISESGCKPISELDKNEKVLTHKGRFRKITKTFKFPQGKLIEIKAALSPKIQLTEEHPVLIYQPQVATHRIKNTWNAYRNWVKHKKREKKLQKYKLSWIKASKLKKGDIVAYPIISKTIDKNVSSEQLEFYGYFAGDGYTTAKKSYRFGIVVGNKENLEDRMRLFKKATGFDPHIDKAHQGCTVLYKDNKKTALKFREMFGKNAFNKRLPQWCMYLPKEKQKHILTGLIKSDGHIRFDNRHIFVTVSPTLANQVKQLVLRQEMIPVVSHGKQYGKGKKRVWRVEWNPAIPHRNYMSADLTKGYLLLPIHNIKVGDYTGAVYNVEVEEDNSYVTTSLALHNSIDVLFITSKYEAHPLIAYEAMACGIPVVSGNIGDLWETVINGENGFIFDQCDQARGFRSALKILRDDEAFRKAMGEEARAAIIWKWKWEDIANQYRFVTKAIHGSPSTVLVEPEPYTYKRASGLITVKKYREARERDAREGCLVTFIMPAVSRVGVTKAVVEGIMKYANFPHLFKAIVHPNLVELKSWLERRGISVESNFYFPIVRAKEAMVRLCDTEYLFMFDNDLKPNAPLKPMLDFMQEHPDVGVCGTSLEGSFLHDLLHHGANFKVTQNRVLLCQPQRKVLPFNYADYVHHGATLFRRKVFDDVAYDVKYPGQGHEHEDLFLQISETDWKVVSYNDCIATPLHDRGDYQYRRLRSRDTLKSARYFNEKWNIRFKVRDNR